jgi:hypothetical protein
MNYILGVINKETNKYENIVFVDKSNKYKCIACESDLILRKGDKNFQSFVHKNKNGCEYFKNPSTEQLLNDAKLYLQRLLEQNNVNIFRKCKICKMKNKMNLPININVNSSLYDTIIYYGDNKFKIYSEKPHEELDYECYQINMLNLIQTCVQDFASKKIELVCSKPITCNECLIKYNN